MHIDHLQQLKTKHVTATLVPEGSPGPCISRGGPSTRGPQLCLWGALGSPLQKKDQILGMRHELCCGGMSSDTDSTLTKVPARERAASLTEGKVPP